MEFLSHILTHMSNNNISEASSNSSVHSEHSEGNILDNNNPVSNNSTYENSNFNNNNNPMSTDFTLRASKSDNIFNPNEFKYLLYKNESKFNYKDFKLNKSNFEAWYEALMRHLIAQNLDSFITRELNINSRDLLMGDNATQSIIVESIDNNSKLYLKGCKTAYQVIKCLKNRYYMSGETLLNELINKINKLKIIDNDYLAYMNELKSLYEQHDQESGRLNKTLMGDEVKTHKA
eukprot:jgi/Orpsp1_1/1191169/evm.model.d7180000083922.1